MGNDIAAKCRYKNVINYISGNIISFILLFCGLAIGIIVVAMNFGCFSLDAFSYYDISKSFSSDFGKVATIRQYVIDSDYNCSFPYLYPLCIFIVDSLTGMGIYSSIIINILIMILTAFLLCHISWKYTKSLFCSAIVSFLLFTNYDYLDGVFSGATLPLSFFLFGISAYIICELYLSQEFSVKKLLVLGLVAGLNVVNRFDEISFLVYLIPAVFVSVPKGRKLLSCLIYSLSAFIPLLPWTVYSLQHFGSFFVSDNSGTLFLVNPLPPNRLVLPGQFVADIFNSPSFWVESVINSFTESLRLMFTDYCLVFTLLLAWLLLVLLEKRTGIKKNKRVASLSLFIVLYAFLKFLMYVFVKYNLDRYFVIISFTLIFLVAILLYNRDIQFETKALNILIVVALLSCNYYYQIFVIADLSDTGVYLDELNWVAEVDTIIQSVGQENDAVITVEENGFAYGAMTGRKTFLQPIFTSYQSINYIIDNNDEIVWMILGKNQDAYNDYIESYYFAEFDDCYLLKIR
ncbi:MAG: hypothetical protein MJ094_08945 [Saccharofermentans sp.]|nr:hypothetical protein [Saccharofermentans sp.]